MRKEKLDNLMRFMGIDTINPIDRKALEMVEGFAIKMENLEDENKKLKKELYETKNHNIVLEDSVMDSLNKISIKCDEIRKENEQLLEQNTEFRKIIRREKRLGDYEYEL